MMYAYYLIAALGPEYRKYLWWKKHVTVAQILQFIIIISYMTVALWTSCNYNPFIIKLVIGEATINLILFLNFYRKAYLNKNVTTQMIICGSLQCIEDENDSISTKKGK